MDVPDNLHIFNYQTVATEGKIALQSPKAYYFFVGIKSRKRAKANREPKTENR